MKKIFSTFFFALSALLAFSALFACASLSSSSGKIKSSAKFVYSNQKKFEEYSKKSFAPVSLKEFSDGFSHARYKYENEIPPYALYSDSQIAGIAENILFLQNPDGGWAKILIFSGFTRSRSFIQSKKK